MGEWNQLLITRASIKGVSLNDNGGYKGFSAEANVTQFRNDFRLPLAGRRLNSSAASVSSQGSYGRYWSSSPDGTSAYSLNLLSSNLNTYGSNYRAYGFSLRCFQNS
ncbi:MAG: fibrobacter succinogenes major paralogous domain-containing protein [Candidatus Peribacteria bacterium]|jgi:hypothetical protein|nr:fibrobacter succinogenes major paralogous domain-containing protein [Candidatus Peribacteria bacterium]